MRLLPAVNFMSQTRPDLLLTLTALSGAALLLAWVTWPDPRDAAPRRCRAVRPATTLALCGVSGAAGARWRSN